MAVSKAGKNPTHQEQRRLVHNGSLKVGLSAGDRATGHSAGADTHVGSSPGGSHGEHTGRRMDSCSHGAVGAPIVLDDDEESDTKLDATSSAADAPDDDRTLGAILTLPPDANDHVLHTSVADVPAKPITNGQAQDPVTDSASDSSQSLGDCSVKPNGVDRIVHSQPSTHRQHDRPPSSPTDETAESPEQDTPYTEAPAAAGHIHDVFAEYERMFGADSLTRKSGQQKGRSSSSQHRTNPVRDGSLLLDGSSAGRLTNMERDDGGSSSQMEDQQRQEPTERTPTQPNPPSRKRSSSPEESHVLDPKRSCGSSRLSPRRASEPKTSTRSNSYKEERLRHAFPRHCRDKQWEVRGIGRISVGEDGSLDCELLWLPTMVSVSTLNGALLERAEELVKQDHGAETWDKWLEIQGMTGRRRCRAKGGNSQREKK